MIEREDRKHSKVKTENNQKETQRKESLIALFEYIRSYGFLDRHFSLVSRNYCRDFHFYFSGTLESCFHECLYQDDYHKICATPGRRRFSQEISSF